MRNEHETPNDLVAAMEGELKRVLEIKEGSKASEPKSIVLQREILRLKEINTKGSLERAGELQRIVNKL